MRGTWAFGCLRFLLPMAPIVVVMVVVVVVADGETKSRWMRSWRERLSKGCLTEFEDVGGVLGVCWGCVGCVGCVGLVKDCGENKEKKMKKLKKLVCVFGTKQTNKTERKEKETKTTCLCLDFPLQLCCIRGRFVQCDRKNA